MSKRGKPVWVAVSGGFDPLHIGHVRMFKAARKYGDKLVIILNNDNWLVNKKGFAFMPEAERKELLLSFPFVDRVVITDHVIGDTDRSVVRTIRKVRPHIFANGGDRTPQDAKKKDSSLNPEQAYCEEKGIRMVFNVGRGGKIQSSSWMIEHAINKSTRPAKARR
jgi:cytidyltransferase-like protein